MKALFYSRFSNPYLKQARLLLKTVILGKPNEESKIKPLS